MGFTVTRELLEGANDYLPIQIKTALAKRQAEACVQNAKEQAAIKTDAGDILPMPPRYFCDEMGRSIYEMSVFTSFYLMCEEPNDDGVINMTAETYDKYAGAHLFGQLNALKSGVFGRDNPELKTKIINMIADFNDYQKRLTSEIKALMSLYNDPVDRFLAVNAALSTPEAMSGLLQELKAAAEDIEKEKAGDAE